ncbi:MAG: AlkZ family DNA glycosylase [Thermoleophilaceae bacterium]|nr:AlkZ family DNA glycosylase [Thermoleophilaceae bacterium]
MARQRTLTTRELNRALLARQGLLARKRVSVVKMIEQVGGLQTQEPRDAFIALWSRIANFDPDKLRQAAERREIVRGSYMRCTLHTVTAEDFRRFRLTLSPVIERDAANWRANYVGLDIPTVRRAVEELLSDDVPRTGREIGKELHEQFPALNLDGLVNCARIHVPVVMTPAGARWHYSRPPQLMLAERWLGDTLERSAASELMLRGLAAIGPASTSDLRTWSGMPGVREAIEPLWPQLKVFRDESGRELFDLPDAPRPRADTPAPVRFLGEFDNVALSHADRARIVDADDAKRFNLSRNGRRAFTVLIDGRVRASWRLERDKQSARVVVTPFHDEPRSTLDELAAEAERLLEFLEPDAGVHTVEFE